MVHLHIGKAILEKAQHAGDHVFAALAQEEFFQPVVAEGGIFHIDLPHDAHLGELLLLPGDAVEILRHGPQVPPQGSSAQAPAPAELLRQLPDPLRHGFGRVARMYLIGERLVFQQEEHVPVDHRPDGGQHHAGGKAEARRPLQAAQAQGDHRHLVHAHIMQGLAQKHDIVGSPAAAPGLEHDEGGLFRVVFPAGQGIKLLPHGADGGVAHIVVQVFQPGVDDLFALVVGDDDVVAMDAENGLQQLHVGGEHVRRQDGMAALHLFGKFH